MIYPDPIGINPLWWPASETITEVLSRSAVRFVGDQMFRPYAVYGKGLETYVKAIRECGGWATAAQVAAIVGKNAHSTNTSMGRFVRMKQLRARYNDAGKREYAEI